MINDLEKGSAQLQTFLDSLRLSLNALEVKSRYQQLFSLARQYTHVPELDRDTLLTFIDQIEVGPKDYPEGTTAAPPPEADLSAVYPHLLQVRRENDGKLHP